jgi:hypothetical protein
MKFIPVYFFLLLTTLPAWVNAQGMKNRCQNGPMDRTQFQQQKQFISTRRSSSELLEAARSLSTSQCLSSEQVKEIASVFMNDFDRLEYAKHAWYSVYDKEEFLVVMDAFIQASNLFRLYDFLREEGGRPTPVNGPGPVLSVQYPDAAIYAGQRGCQDWVNETGFQQVLTGVKNQPEDNSRMKYLQGLWSLNCFSVAQTMLLSQEFQQESTRLQFLKNASSRVYDTGNLNFAIQVFQTEGMRKDWSQFLASRSSQTATPVPQETAPCQVSPEALTRIVNSINQQSVSSSKVNIARQQIQMNKCFTARQIKSIVATIPIESGRLEVMKFAYDYTTDKPEFLNILDVLSVLSSRDEIIRMVR